MPVLIRGRYDDDTPPGVYDTEVVGESMTVQGYKDDCDINRIVKMYLTQGVEPSVQQRVAQFADVSDLVDYQDSLNKVLEAEGLFAALPSELRRRFNDDPATMLQWVDDPNNRDEAIRIGLLAGRVVQPSVVQPSVVQQEVKK